MAPTDASTDAGAPTATATGTGPRTGPETGPATGTATDAGADTPSQDTHSQDADSQDTLDLHLPDELVALFTDAAPEPEADQPAEGPGRAGGAQAPSAARVTTLAEAPAAADAGGHDKAQPLAGLMPADLAAFADDDLLDNLAAWGPASTPAGVFRLVPVRVERDLSLISRWMNDPAVAEFWELDGPASVTEAHLRPQLEGDGRSVPCLGVLDGAPMSYWEIYRADLDPVSRYYPARPHDTGVHLLIGGVAHRGRGLGTILLRAVADLVLDHRLRCTRVIAEPDLRNTPSVSAFLSAGFRFSAEVDLPGKRAAIMVRDRALRMTT
ncbi:GNAT family N-acetyltransferase [Streptomyces sp. NPDC002577]